MIIKKRILFKILSVLAIPFLLIAFTIILAVTIIYSKLFEKKPVKKEEDHIENDDLSYCLLPEDDD